MVLLRVFVIFLVAILFVMLMLIAQMTLHSCTPGHHSHLHSEQLLSHSTSAMIDREKTLKKKTNRVKYNTTEHQLIHENATLTNSTQTFRRKYEKQHLTQRDIDGVRYFVLFIGYAHSGHSIIGSMMDAHPNMVIAHEYNVIGKWSRARERLSDKNTLFNELCDKSRSTTVPNGWYNNDMKGYTLAIPDLWQGCQFTDLKVIGDKRGGIFTDTVRKSDIEKIRKDFNEVKETVGVPIKLIHVVRNPFDIIATTHIGGKVVGQHRWGDDDFEEDHNITTKVMYRMKDKAETIMTVGKEWGADMLEIHHADFVHDPKASLQRICDFVDVDCPKEYLDTCYNKTFKTVSQSRHLIKWPPEVIELGEAMMKKIPFYRRYSFDSE